MSWAIMDSNGVIHDGGEDEMRQAFDVMLSPEEYDDNIVELWDTDWAGDLLLVQIHERG